MTFEAPTHTGTVHMYSYTWFVSGGVVRSNAFVQLELVVSFAVVPQDSRIKVTLLLFGAQEH